MPNSMTGYGLGESQDGGPKVTVEARSVNHRYIEVGVKSAFKSFSMDDLVRKKIKGRFNRGAFEVLVSVDMMDTSAAVRINEPLLKGYLHAAAELSESHGIPFPPTFGDLASIRDIFIVSGDAVDMGALSGPLEIAMDQAMERLAQMRATEGAHTADDLSERFGRIHAWVVEIKTLNEESAGQRYNTLKEKVTRLLSGSALDESRLAQEAAILTERSDISEELIRMDSHLKKAAEMLADEGQVGRKLEFLLQELGRETNTMGSKSYSTQITRLVLEIKGELEKLREQSQNLE